MYHPSAYVWWLEIMTSFFGQFRLVTCPVFGSLTIQSGMSSLAIPELSYVTRIEVGANNWVVITADGPCGQSWSADAGGY